MSNKYICEYCGRQIEDSVCPFCGGINIIHPTDKKTHPAKNEPDNGSVSTEIPDRSEGSPETAGTGARRIQFSKRTKILLVLAAFFVLCLISYAVTPKSKTSIQKTDKNGYFLTEEGSTLSNHVLDGYAEERIQLNAMGKKTEMVVPCDYEYITANFNILPINTFLDNDRNSSYTEKALASVKPYNQIWIYDSYNIFQFCIYNGSAQESPLDECICDSLTITDPSKVTSALFHGKELIQDTVGILDTFGEPSFQYLSESFYSITYDTSCGSLRVSYLLDENGVLSACPFSITVDNCQESRSFFS